MIIDQGFYILLGELFFSKTGKTNPIDSGEEMHVRSTTPAVTALNYSVRHAESPPPVIQPVSVAPPANASTINEETRSSHHDATEASKERPSTEASKERPSTEASKKRPPSTEASKERPPSAEASKERPPSTESKRNNKHFQDHSRVSTPTREATTPIE